MITTLASIVEATLAAECASLQGQKGKCVLAACMMMQHALYTAVDRSLEIRIDCYLLISCSSM